MPTAEDAAAASVHAAGLLLAVVLGAGLLRLADRSSASHEQRRAVVTFVGAWLALYAASIAFHLAPGGDLRRFLSALDNGAIFVLVAAGWAPIAPFKLPPREAQRMLLFVWGLALAGLVGEGVAVLAGYQQWFQEIAYAVYLTQGSAPVLLYGRTIFGGLSYASLGWLFGSIAVYGLGFAFYRHPEMPWGHVAWHAAIVAACMLNHGGVRQLLIENRSGNGLPLREAAQGRAGCAP